MLSVLEPLVGGARGKERPPQDIISEESEETSSSDGEDPDYGHDEIGFSQIPDAPGPTQDTPPPKRRTRARARDHTDVGSANILPTKPILVVPRNLSPHIRPMTSMVLGMFEQGLVASTSMLGTSEV